MVVLEVTVLPLGTFQVNDDYTVTDINLLPTTGDNEVQALTDMMQEKKSSDTLVKDTLRASLFTLYPTFTDSDLVIRSDNEPKLQFEPDET